MTLRRAEAAKRVPLQVFRDIVVMPTQSLLAGTGRDGGLFRGGPDFPFFPLQRRARHCRGLVPVPWDRRPARETPTHMREAGIWCGPVCPHFGHMIADFGMRIAQAAARSDLPLVFSVGPDREAEPPGFFREMLHHLGVAESRILLVREPTRFGTLHVPAQAERHLGKGPDKAHLDLMDALVARHGSVQQDIGLLYVSRARFPDGRLVAEGYLDAALARAGAYVMHPETLDLAAQLDLYRRARRIAFSEGSAVHCLQLLGRLDAEVIVLVRRPGTRIARRHLQPRAKNLAYWDVTAHLIYGRHPSGRRQINRALSLVDEAGLLARFRDIGFDLAPHWDGEAYRAACEADLRHWIAYMRHWDLHPRAAETIRRCLKAAKVEIAFEEAWQAPFPAQ